VPHAGDRPVDQQDRVVAGLPAGQRACGGVAGVEQLTRLTAHHVRIEVRQQPDSVGNGRRRNGVACAHPGGTARELHAFELVAGPYACR
jgi:hypothetical protein